MGPLLSSLWLLLSALALAIVTFVPIGSVNAGPAGTLVCTVVSVGPVGGSNRSDFYNKCGYPVWIYVCTGVQVSVTQPPCRFSGDYFPVKIEPHLTATYQLANVGSAYADAKECTKFTKIPDGLLSEFPCSPYDGLDKVFDLPAQYSFWQLDTRFVRRSASDYVAVVYENFTNRNSLVQFYWDKTSATFQFRRISSGNYSDIALDYFQNVFVFDSDTNEIVKFSNQNGVLSKSTIAKISKAYGTLVGRPVISRQGILYASTLSTGYKSSFFTVKLPTATSLTPVVTKIGSYSLYDQDTSIHNWTLAISPKDGSIFGTTSESGGGSVFTLTPTSTQGRPWTLSRIHEVDYQASLGSWPVSDLVIDIKGTVYGVKRHGGIVAYGGVVFSLTPPSAGSITWTYNVLHSFKGTPDGMSPDAGLVIASDGTLFGQTSQGGLPKVTACGTGINKVTVPQTGCGVVFSLKKAATGLTWTETMHKAFSVAEGGSHFARQTPYIDTDGNILFTGNSGGAFGTGSLWRVVR